MIYTIENEILSVKVDTSGAEIIGVIFNGRERSWQNETGEWSGHAPILFPVCGNCSVIVNGKKYEMPKHGFVLSREFECVHCDGKSVKFRLCSDTQTKSIYPFSFIMYVEYRVVGDTIEVCYTVENTGDNFLYFSVGGHDSFALDKNICEYKLIFDKVEKFDALIHDDEGMLTGEVVRMGEGKVLQLPEDFLQNGQTLILSRLNSAGVTLCHTSGTPIVRLSLDGFDNLLLWRPNNAKMICIEPWMNLPDNKITVDSEFGDKRCVRCVKQSESAEISRIIAYYK